MSATIDWSALRKDFPILDQKVHGKPLVYFDNAATSQMIRLQKRRLDLQLNYVCDRDHSRTVAPPD